VAYKIRPYKRRGVVDGFEVYISVEMPDGTTTREKKKSPVTSKSGTERWAQAREREILTTGLAPRKVADAPKLSEFWERFMRDHARANGQKPSGIESKEYGYRQFLQPRLGHLGLDEITTEEIAKLKSWMVGEKKLAPATVNNTLALMSKVLKVALEWNVISVMPCRITRLKSQAPTPEFYDFEEYERIVDAARELGSHYYLLVLLGGDAGLRRGEIIALEQSRCDTKLKQLRIEQSEWQGHLTATKGMEARIVPMTDRLCDAIKAHRHLRSPRLLVGERGGQASKNALRSWMERVQCAAGIDDASGELHILRHTFCSHLAMRGVPATVIQKLAGHKSLQTTLRYMHVSEGETDRAIRLLGRGGHGGVVAAGKSDAKKPANLA
jgi:integrase